MRITIDFTSDIATPEFMETVEDKLRDYLRLLFAGRISGEITDDVTGNSTKI